jgi:single-strand DNA-binding protein
MSDHAANLAVQPNSSLKEPSVPSASCRERNGEYSMPSFKELLPRCERLPFGRTSAAEIERITLAHRGVFRLVSRPLLGVTLRAYPPPGGRLALLPWLRHPTGYGFRLRRTLRKCRASALGGGVSRLALPSVTRAGYGKFNETEITTMYQNKVTLIGFLGNDADVRTNDNRSLTTLSLATKYSYKKDGKYIEHTEWHRCVVFGKLGEFAATLKKGAHIQAEGELRSRKYDSKKTNSEQTIWEIRVNAILKLDRAAKASAEDDDASREELAS